MNTDASSLHGRCLPKETTSHLADASLRGRMDQQVEGNEALACVHAPWIEGTLSSKCIGPGKRGSPDVHGPGTLLVPRHWAVRQVAALSKL